MSESDNQNMIYLKQGIAIPRADLHFRTARSSGPGGQHVNKVETKVELLYDIANASTLSEEDKAHLLQMLRHRIDAEGILHVASEEYRSQYKNREATVEKFVTLLQHAFTPKKIRKPTRIPRAVTERRLQAKHQRSAIKTQRRGRPGEE